MKRKYLRKGENMGIVYHYCSVPAFISIIRKKELWLTDVLKSNDPMEGQKILSDVFTYFNYNDEIKNVYENTDLYWIMDLIQNYECEVKDYTNYNSYAMCFSKKGDLLSQWRGYTPNAAGLSIGFDESFFENWQYYSNNKAIVEYGEVKYTKSMEDIERIFKKLVELGKNISIPANFEKEDYLEQPFYQYLELLSQKALFVKDIGFAEECEKRLVYREFYHYDDRKKYNYKEFASPKTINENKKGLHLSELSYYVSDYDFKRYYPLDFKDVTNGFIKEIIIGPNCAASSSYIEDLLCREKYSIGPEGIVLKNSEINYR